MSGTAIIDTSKFNAMIRELSRKAEVPDDQVLVHEIGKVLEATIANTPALKVSKLRARTEAALFSAQPASLYSPKRGRRGVSLTKNGFIPYYLRNRYPDALWNAIAARRTASLRRALKARGLAKKSWWEIAKALGLTIAVPGYVTSAIPSTGRTYQGNTKVSVARASAKLQIKIENAQPTVNLPTVGGTRALQRAIDGRTKFFIQNIGRGVFNDLEKIAKKYPGMKVS